MKLTSSYLVTSTLFLPSFVASHWVLCNHRSFNPFGVAFRDHLVPRNRDLFFDMIGGGFASPFSTSTRSLSEGFSRGQIRESEDSFEVVMDVPGIKADDIVVQLEGPKKNILHLKGECTKSSEDGTYQSSRKFDKSYTFDPDTVDVEKISVSLESGVLTVNLPKTPKDLDNNSDAIQNIPVVTKDDSVEKIDGLTITTDEE
eukprot:CAMPEP_0116070266 /NCGR_PEP_ID=MMETSP0322-20121206/12906_1 /TAXON_ID=163516 /ORGANISM="Leptocylindrus danicus var. apora, Strain B651" /LENGTH=200 /DNA_ID=CAMNT_0003558039 /DNA_START=86 /DNA_END=688 /DNA_ORIENTATION=+